MEKDTDRRLTHSLAEGAYRSLKVRAAMDGVSMKTALESAIGLYAGTSGPFLVSATCPACEKRLQVSTSGKTYLGGPGGRNAELSEESIALAETLDALRKKNPVAIEAIESLIRTL